MKTTFNKMNLDIERKNSLLIAKQCRFAAKMAENKKKWPEIQTALVKKWGNEAKAYDWIRNLIDDKFCYAGRRNYNKRVYTLQGKLPKGKPTL